MRILHNEVIFRTTSILLPAGPVRYPDNTPDTLLALFHISMSCLGEFIRYYELELYINAPVRLKAV